MPNHSFALTARAVTRRIALASLASVLASGARADVVSRFDSSADGWSVVSFTNLSTPDYSVFSIITPTWNPTGGIPGGFINVADPDNGDFTFSAPASFLGDHHGATCLSYDLTESSSDTYQTSDVMITGGGLRLLWHRNPEIDPTPTFQTISVPLDVSTGWTVGSRSGPSATSTDFQAVLSDIAGLFIRGDYHADLDEIAGLDNVVLAESVPEPSSLAILAGALVGCRLKRRAAG